MNAIDYAARLSASFLKNHTSLLESACLCAIAAGLEEMVDLANFLDTTPAVVTRSLKRLIRYGYVINSPLATDAEGVTYRLSKPGRDYLRHLLAFLPQPPTH